MTTWSTCPNGHRYDPSLTPECPECAALRSFLAPLKKSETGGNEGCSLNIPGQIVPRHTVVPVTEPKERNIIPLQDPLVDGCSKTMAIDWDEQYSEDSVEPITGWLVCIEGPERGADYRLHKENNFIGRSHQMDVCISGDHTVTEERHAVVAYDSLKNKFFFSPSGGSIVYLNDKAVLTVAEIRCGDRLGIGQSVFLFIPLCGERFQWEK